MSGVPVFEPTRTPTPTMGMRALLCLSAAALLSACAGNTPGRTPMTAQQEVKTYIARAKPSYAPPGPPGDPWRPYIDEASRKYDVPERWIREVMRVESNGMQYRPSGVLTTSPVGAMGLMQLMPATYDEVRARYSLGDDAFDPHNNILAGTAYLREMYDAFGSPGMLAAYNGGPARLQDYLVHNRPLPDETRRYVAMIGPYIAGAWPVSRSPAEQFAVNRLPMEIPAGPRYVVHRVLVAWHVRGRHGHETIRYAARVRIIQSGRSHGRSVEVAEAPEPRRAAHAGVHYASASVPITSVYGSHHSFQLISSARAGELDRPAATKWGHAPLHAHTVSVRLHASHSAGHARGPETHASCRKHTRCT